MNNLMSVVSRVRYCSRCAENKTPRKGQRYVLFHQSHGEFVVHKAHHAPVNGFSPHTFEYAGLSEEGNAIVKITCCVDGCGITLQKKKDNEYDIFYKMTSIIQMPLTEYNAMRTFTNTGYEIIELCPHTS